jgi:hypothetical protein
MLLLMVGLGRVRRVVGVLLLLVVVVVVVLLLLVVLLVVVVFNRISLIPPTTTTRMQHAGYGGSSWNQMIPPDPTKIPPDSRDLVESNDPTTRSHQIPPDPTRSHHIPPDPTMRHAVLAFDWVLCC